MQDHDRLIERVDRLERANRRLTLLSFGCLLLPLAAIVGFQATPDLLRAKHIQVVDDRGVPLITLEASRTGKGGSVVLRDEKGEKRSWWEVEPGNSELTLSSSQDDGTVDTTLGLQAGTKNGRLAIITQDGTMASTSVDADQPKLQLMGPKGKMLFEAPWKSIGF